MLTRNPTLLEIFNSNIRPPIKPVITVNGTDSNGDDVYLEWTSNNIIDMSYKRGIDPTGQNLPFIELTWKEFYFGKLNADNYPEKYDNIVKYMIVNLSFVYEQTFFRTWDDISSYTWDEVNAKFSSWDDLLKGSLRETIDGFPPTLLVAKPVIEGHTITWTARDLMYFLDKDVSKSFAKNIPYVNPIRWLILNELSRFSTDAEQQWDYLYTLQSDLQELETFYELSSHLIFEGQTKNLLKDYVTPIGWFWDFTADYFEPREFYSILNQRTPVFTFTSKIMRNYPQLTRRPDISDYQFKRYHAEEDTDNEYTMTPTGSVICYDAYGTDIDVEEYLYKDYSKSTALSGSSISKKGYGAPTGSSTGQITVTPIAYNGYEEKISINSKGDTYLEDNRLNSFGASSYYMQDRAMYLDHWYKGYLIVIDSLSNVALETGDLIEVETNLYNGSEKITKEAVVTQIEITYNGVLKQRTYANEV